MTDRASTTNNLGSHRNCLWENGACRLSQRWDPRHRSSVLVQVLDGKQQNWVLDDFVSKRIHEKDIGQLPEAVGVLEKQVYSWEQHSNHTAELVW